MTSDMNSRQLYSRLLTYVRPYWKVFAAAMLATGLSSLTEPFFPAVMKKMLDDGFSSGQLRPPAHPACRCTLLYRRAPG